MIRLASLLIESAVNANFLQMIKSWENSIKSGWNSSAKRWFPHTSPEGGNPTIAYGHKITDAELNTGKFSNGVTEQEATRMLMSDLQIATDKAKRLVPTYDTLPENIQQALINACYRGELKSTYDTVKLMNANKWKEASKEYLNREDYNSGSSGLKRRMDWNATQFASYAPKPTSYTDTVGNWARSIQNKALSLPIHTVKPGDTLSDIAEKYKTTVDSLKQINQLKTDTIRVGQKLKLK
jgi:LysM repeat protein